MKTSRYSFSGNQIYHRYYTALRGVDLSSDPSEVSRKHFAFLENMWCDPVATDGVATESFPGFRSFARFGAPVLGIFRHRVGGEDYLVVHAGERLFRFPERLRNYPLTLAAIAPLDVTVKAEKGCAFSFGERLCLLIGGRYLCIERDGTLLTLDQNESLAYVPLTYLNGVPHEQRNLLSNTVRIAFTADGAYESAVTENGLLFSVLNEEEKTCVVRMSKEYRGVGKVTVPPSVKIGAESYTVTAVATDGFAGMMGLLSISLPETVTLIGPRAFYGDSALKVLSLPSQTYGIGREAFFGCLSLSQLYLGAGALNHVDEGAFTYCQSLAEVRFGGTEEEYAAITFAEGADPAAAGAEVVFSAEPFESSGTVYRYPLYEPCLSLCEVALGGTVLAQSFLPYEDGYIRYREVRTDELVTHVELFVSSPALVEGKRLTVRATVSPTRFSEIGGGFGTEGRDALCGCRTVGKYDGRVFFTGNEKFPNTVFFSAPDDSGVNNPFYIGCFNYFNDGTGAVPNRAFLVTGGLLAVCKAHGGGEGEIFFHTPASGGNDLVPRVYPTVSSFPGVGVAGDLALHYDGEALFLGKRGLFALVPGDTENDRILLPRSGAVDLHLANEDTANASAAIFEGILYLLTNGRIYLGNAKRRTHTGGSAEYEWYRLSGVGSYAGDVPVYRYTAHLPEGGAEQGLCIHPRVGEEAAGPVYSLTLTGGQVYYAKEADGSYPVDTDGERKGGTFFPATVLCATEHALYYGTAEGAVGCFNTDKRGQALYRCVPTPRYLKNEDGTYSALNKMLPRLFSEDMLTRERLYERHDDRYDALILADVYHDGDCACLVKPIGERAQSGKIHRYYYSFDGHPYRCACALATDDGDAPQYAKDTVPRSPTVKLKTLAGGKISVLVRTDRHPFRLCDTLAPGAADAADTDFSAFTFTTDDFASVPLRERERGWCYKQYLFESSAHRAPFGIFSLTYSFYPSGRIKP